MICALAWSWLSLVAVGVLATCEGVPMTSDALEACRQTKPSCTQDSSFLRGSCCMHAGVPATLLAFEDDPMWEPRLKEFNDCTGSQIKLSYVSGGEEAMESALKADVGVSYELKDGAQYHTAGSGVYDGYIVQPPWLPPILDGLENLSESIGSADINWMDINPASREAVSFEGQVKALPLDSDYVALGLRQDVFDKYEKQAPETLEDLAQLAEFFSGLDHNDDGEPDFGFCVSSTVNYLFAFVAPVLQTTTKDCRWEPGASTPICDGASTGQNIFFDTTSFEPLITNPGFRYAVDMFRRVLNASNCQEQLGAKSPNKDCVRQVAFQQGRCAGVISMPGTLTSMLRPHDYGGTTSPVRKDELGNVVWEPKTKDGSHWAKRVRFPGSHRVWDRRTNTLSTCTRTLCPKAEIHSVSQQLVNYAPFFAEGGECYALRKASSPKKKRMLLDFFFWLASLPVTALPLSGLYRMSHLTEKAQRELALNWISQQQREDAGDYNGWAEAMAADMVQLLRLYFQDTSQVGNHAQDLFIMGFSEYMLALKTTLIDGLVLRDDVFFVDAATDSGTFDAKYDIAIAALMDKMQTITSKYGDILQLQRWRALLGLPTLSKITICKTMLPGSSSCPTLGSGNVGEQIRFLLGMGFIPVEVFWFTVVTFLVVHRNTRVIFAASPTFLRLCLIGIQMVLLASLTVLFSNSQLVCCLRAALFNLGFTCTFTALFLKTWRLFRIFRNTTLKPVTLDDGRLLLHAAWILGLDSLLLAIWLGVSPYVVLSRHSALSRGWTDVCYSTGGSVALYGFFGLKAVGLCLLGIAQHSVRDVPDLYHEGRALTLVVYTTGLVSILWVLLYRLLGDSIGPGNMLALEAVTLLVVCALILILLFVPKMVAVGTAQGFARTDTVWTHSVIHPNSEKGRERSFSSTSTGDLDARIQALMRERQRLGKQLESDKQACERVKARLQELNAAMELTKGDNFRIHLELNFIARNSDFKLPHEEQQFSFLTRAKRSSTPRLVLAHTPKSMSVATSQASPAAVSSAAHSPPLLRPTRGQMQFGGSPEANVSRSSQKCDKISNTFSGRSGSSSAISADGISSTVFPSGVLSPRFLSGPRNVRAHPEDTGAPKSMRTALNESDGHQARSESVSLTAAHSRCQSQTASQVDNIKVGPRSDSLPASSSKQQDNSEKSFDGRVSPRTDKSIDQGRGSCSRGEESEQEAGVVLHLTSFPPAAEPPSPKAGTIYSQLLIGTGGEGVPHRPL